MMHFSSVQKIALTIFGNELVSKFIVESLIEVKIFLVSNSYKILNVMNLHFLIKS